IAYANRARTCVAREVVPRRFVQLATTIDAVHDLQRTVLVGLDIGNELHELVRFPVKVEPVERLEHKGCVAHPRVAVVPIALSARCLWEGGGESRDRRAGRHKGQTFDGECRALDWDTVMVVRNAGSPKPCTPIPNRGCDPSFSFLGVLWCGESFVPGEYTIRPIARPEEVVRPNAVSLNPQCEIRAEADCTLRAARVGCMAVAVDWSPLRRYAAVVEGGLAEKFDLDPAFEA